MAIKVLIIRHGDPRCIEDLKPLVQNLHVLAHAQPGYLSGETFQNLDDPTEHLVVSSWSSPEAWMDWFHKPERATLQTYIDALLERPTEYRVYVKTPVI